MERLWEPWQPARGLLVRLRLAWNVLRGRPTLYRAHIRGALIVAGHLRGAQLLIEPPPGGHAIEVTGVQRVALSDVTVRVSDAALEREGQ